jgi:acyl carrier protein
MTFLEARRIVLKALDNATNIFDDVNIRAKINNPDVDVSFEELELDSLSAVECCQSIEHDTNVDIDPADLAIHNSINKLARYLAARTSAA